eukprot:242381-Chlamydomonas_euryale.AAC.4
MSAHRQAWTSCVGMAAVEAYDAQQLWGHTMHDSCGGIWCMTAVGAYDARQLWVHTMPDSCSRHDADASGCRAAQLAPTASLS